MHFPLSPVVSVGLICESSSSILIKALDVPLELVVESLEEFGMGLLDELGTGSLEEFGTGLLEELGTGSLDGHETDVLSQLNHMNAVPRMKNFPRSRFILLFML